MNMQSNQEKAVNRASLLVTRHCVVQPSASAGRRGKIRHAADARLQQQNMQQQKADAEIVLTMI
jgi:hypothetical protein